MAGFPRTRDSAARSLARGSEGWRFRQINNAYKGLIDIITQFTRAAGEEGVAGVAAGHAGMAESNALIAASGERVGGTVEPTVLRTCLTSSFSPSPRSSAQREGQATRRWGS